MAVLAGKVALVTGGARGIGKAICKALLDENVKVCLGDVAVEKGEATLKEFREEYGEQNVIFEKLDVTEEEEFESAIKRVKDHFGGHLDILVNNAGIVDETDWKKMLRINLFGVMHGIELSHRHLCNSNGEKGGTVINISSLAAINPTPHAPCYTAAKQSVVGLTLTWGHENNVKRTNVKVNAICPDAVETDLFSSMVGVIGVDAVMNHVKETKRSGEILQPCDVAEGVIKVLRDDVTRAVLVVRRSESKELFNYYPYSKDDIFFELDKI